MLLEIGLADAYGAHFEFNNNPEVNDLSHMWAHPTHGNKAGSYTDDTQMSLANAEVILHKGLQNNPDLIYHKDFNAVVVKSWLETFRRDHRKGYAKGFQAFLESCKDEHDFLARIRPDSEKNGAAMRAVPWALLPTLADALHASRKQAEITHNTVRGITAAEVVTYLAWNARAGLELTSSSMIKQLYDGFYITPAHDSKVSVLGISTVSNAYGILIENQDKKMSTLLKTCCDRRGDIDSLAAIVIGIVSLSPYYENDLWEYNFYFQIENGFHGANYLSDMDIKLGLFK